ncbi:cytochrome c oxidase subunit II [Oceanicella actignis]|uniref:Cytochrome c oxidase subunit 2 n=1 Tax=Oceanicella actignis TaxID=1189325 RepID=A0A1M7TJJ8_9RHOB|nr:cytochrome c oxidase subunit II [Oceanicella actignis]TYO88175.1 cytochrome c oxidase subunit 2 [Oceanicella actignis]SET66688.1 cytochrome c oxidase subunit 2 [Oceanicella actignis]SHN70897.1 cytochrome c oxidase subunit 2 [Oceanicella actignis]
MRIAKTAAATVLGMLAAGVAWGQENVGMPVPGGTSLQPAATEVARDLHWMDNFLLYIIAAITLFVMALLLIVIIRFNERANKTPARFTHNSLLEVAWTLVPVLILVAIAVPSLRLLDKQVTIPDADVTIKATGNQWYWSYAYADEGIEFDSFMVGSGFKDFDTAMADPDAAELIKKTGTTRETWLLQTDTEVVVPVGKVVRLLTTGADVIHSWAMPAFGVKIDAVPGRLNESWFRVDKPGRYFGQCSELCGKDHAYMPIVVRAVPQDEYDAWVRKTREQLAAADAPLRLASAR